MFVLSNSTLAGLEPAVDAPATTALRSAAGLFHSGVGNFHRVHLDLYVDDGLRRGLRFCMGIVGVVPTKGSLQPPRPPPM